MGWFNNQKKIPTNSTKYIPDQETVSHITFNNEKKSLQEIQLLAIELNRIAHEIEKRASGRS